MDRKIYEFPPLEFPKLVEDRLPEGELKKQVQLLLKRKISGDELDFEQKIEVINDFLNDEILQLREYAKTLNSDITDFTPNLDQLFRSTLEEVWN